MFNLRARLHDYWRITSLWGAYALLFTLWAEQCAQFFQNMLPRLAHLGPSGMLVADKPCFYPQCDFSVFWPAGLLARAGQTGVIYAPTLFQTARLASFGPHAAPLYWYYPPPALLLVTPFSLVPFEPGFYLWTAVLTAAAALLLRAAGMTWLVIAVALASPACLWNLELGQLGALTGAAFLAGLALNRRRPASAGLAFALLAIKPQAGLLAPFACVAAGAWRTVLTAAFAALALAAATTLLFGAAIWHDYLAAGLTASRAVLITPDLSGSAKFGISVFWMVRSFGATVAMASAIQTAAAIAAAALAFLAWRDNTLTLQAQLAITASLALLATPYGYTDDMVAFSAALAFAASKRHWHIGFPETLFFTWPILSPLIFQRTGLALTPLVTTAAAVLIWRRPAAYGIAPVTPGAMNVAERIPD